MKKEDLRLLSGVAGLLVTVIVVLGCKEGGRYPARMVCQTDLIMLSRHIERYAGVVGHFPSEEEGLGVFVHPPHAPEDRVKWRVQLYDDLPLDPWHRHFVYRLPGRRNPAGFDLFSLGPDGVESDDDIYPTPEKEEKGRKGEEEKENRSGKVGVSPKY